MSKYYKIDNSYYIPRLNTNIEIKIGKNQAGNDYLVRNSLKNDLWFHLSDFSSAHIIASIHDINNILTKEEFDSIILYCSTLLFKISHKHNKNPLKIVYTYIKNLTLTSTLGLVELNDNVNYITIKID